MGAFGDVAYQGRQLLYVLTGIDDPNFVACMDGDGNPFDSQAFFDFINSQGLGEYVKVVSHHVTNSTLSVNKVDLRVEQQLPAFSNDHEASAFFVVENLGNLLNDDWVLYEASSTRCDGR